MANLKEIRTRISSVISTKQITSAMKMVAAAKLRKAQDAIIQMRPYALKLEEILSNLSENIRYEQEHAYIAHKEVKRILIIAVSSNKGLCGAFNANVVKKIIQLIDENYSKAYSLGQVDLICIGKKGSEILRSKGVNIAENHHEIFDKISFNRVNSLANTIIDSYTSGIYDEIKIVYNQFKNAGVQELVAEQFLPIIPNAAPTTSIEKKYDYILEPSKKGIVNELIPKLLRIKLYKAILDSNASEHGARMTAMHKATDNAIEMIKQLNLDYNKARQASITKEILEIVAGAEAQSSK
jgi:F-type H+-transporting ATPase subunit gamma